MSKLKLLMLFVACLPLLGARACSKDEECLAAQAAARLACAEGGDPEACALAKEQAEAACRPDPKPTPTPTPEPTPTPSPTPDLNAEWCATTSGALPCWAVRTEGPPPECVYYSADGRVSDPVPCSLVVKPRPSDCPKGQHIVCRDPEAALVAALALGQESFGAAALLDKLLGCECVPDDPTPGGDIPHGEWIGPAAANPTLVDVTNAALTAITGCALNSDCPVAPGSGEVGHEQGWKNYDAFQVKWVEEMRRRGHAAGFHTEPEHPDEACAFDLFGSPACEGYKVATNGGKIKVAWAGQPARPCAGEDCRRVGGGSYRGNWTPGTPAPSSCGEPRPSGPPAKSKPKLFHVGPAKVTMDVAFLFGPSRDYCAAAGWTDGRLYCPVRPEGSPDHKACETEFVGTPTWVATIDGDILPPGFLYSVPKRTFVVGRTESFSACAKGTCATATVTLNADGTFSSTAP